MENEFNENIVDEVVEKKTHKETIKKIVVFEGCEKFYDIAVTMKEEFENDFEKAKVDAIAKVEEDFANRKDRLDRIFKEVCEEIEEEIEVEDKDETETENDVTNNVEV